MNSKKKRIKNTNKYISFIARAIIILSIFLAIYKLDWTWAAGTFIGLFISFFPGIIKHDIKLILPWIFDLLIATISILHIGGRLLEFYIIIPGYQLITQFFIAILVAFLSLTIIYILDEHWDGLIMDKNAMAFVTVICTMSIGVFLEFVKWLNISGTYYEKTNQTLMLNLTVNTIAGMIIAIIGVSLIKSGTLEKITDDFGKQIDELLLRKSKEKEKNDST